MVRDERPERVFRALADRTRRQILDRLKDQAMTTGQLCDEMSPLDRCTTMKHLRVLARADLIIVRREGRFRWNHLNAVPIQRIYDRWISQYARPSVELLTRLQRDVEGTVLSPGSAAVGGDVRTTART